jgi:hypothetical protein
MENNIEVLQNNDFFSVPVFVINGKIIPADQNEIKLKEEILINILKNQPYE